MGGGKGKAELMTANAQKRGSWQAEEEVILIPLLQSSEIGF